jgi:hypothetical protein
MGVNKRDFYPAEGYQYSSNEKAKWTGEFRPPRQGEYFLSGAIIQAYKAHKDMTTPYHIAKIVRTKTITIVVEDK